jgi:hypothetical protein
MKTPLSQQLDVLAAWRGGLQRHIAELATFLAHNELAAQSERAAIDTLGRKLAADKLVLACVAEVSRGKSELLNAIFFADAKRRVLPATPGRTTMCPVELHFRAGQPAELALLPIETRLGGAALDELRQQPSAWQRLGLDPRNPDGLSEALLLVTQTRRVSTAEAAALGLWSDSELADNPPLGADGLVEVPAWRHALINYPHPLLERGLVVIDTPGLNAVGAEPDLTLSLLPSAHAVVFLVGADTGVTRSDLTIWNEHLGGVALERFVVLNKIDILDDPLSSPAVVAAQVQRQRRAVAQSLGVPSARVFALSARDALAARVHDDAAALAASGLPALEAALGAELLPRQQALLSQATEATLLLVRQAAARRLGERRRHITEQTLELRGLRGKSGAKVGAMLKRLEAEMAEFDLCHARLAALRSVHLRMMRKVLALLSSDALRREVASMQRAFGAMPLKLGARKAFGELCEWLRRSLAAAGQGADEMQQMLAGSYRQLNSEFGFAFNVVAGPGLRRYVNELDLIERSYGRYLVPTQAWRLSGAGFMDQFQRMLVSKLRTVFESAAGDIELWGKGATSQIELQLRERKAAFEHRHQSLQRVQGAAGDLEARIAEVEAQDKRLAELMWRLDRMANQILAVAEAAPSAAATTRPARAGGAAARGEPALAAAAA